jgi:hypothetical protein
MDGRLIAAKKINKSRKLNDLTKMKKATSLRNGAFKKRQACTTF